MTRVMSATIKTAMDAGFDQWEQKATMIAMIKSVAHKKVFFILHTLANVIRLF